MSNEKKWTPEPWHVDGMCPSAVGESGSGYNNHVATCYSGGTNSADYNADRIVACVNACAGMDDPVAEIELLRKMDSGAIVRETDSFITMQAERDTAREKLAKLRASHADLLEALKEARHDLIGYGDMRHVAPTVEMADQALTNAEAIK